MREIDETTAAQYLIETNRLDAAVPVRPLSGGVSNVVLWIDAPSGPYVLKQSRPQLRTADPWYSDIRRIHREVAALRAIGPVLGNLVPEVLFEDADNFLFAMSAAPEHAKTWKEQLLGGIVDPELADLAGSSLGLLHQYGFGNPQWEHDFGDTRNFHELRLEPYYLRLSKRRADLRRHLVPLIERTENSARTLVHADFSPKNMLVTDNGFLLVDYETVHFGDPTFDLGFFLAHLTLKAIHHQHRFHEYATLIRRFWHAYLKTVTFASEKSLVKESLQHLAANLFVRIDGTSPVDYLCDAHKETGRLYAFALFSNTLDSYGDSIELLESALRKSAAT